MPENKKACVAIVANSAYVCPSNFYLGFLRRPFVIMDGGRLIINGFPIPVDLFGLQTQAPMVRFSHGSWSCWPVIASSFAPPPFRPFAPPPAPPRSSLGPRPATHQQPATPSRCPPWFDRWSQCVRRISSELPAPHVPPG